MGDKFLTALDLVISDTDRVLPSEYGRIQVKNDGKLHLRVFGTEQVLEQNTVYFQTGESPTTPSSADISKPFILYLKSPSTNEITIYYWEP